jgi:hypothetical protein
MIRYDTMRCDAIHDIWYYIYDIYDMIYDIWYDMIWYMIWYMIRYDIWTIWYDAIYDIWYDIYDMIYDIWYDMIWYMIRYDIYDIFVNCNWVATRWQYLSTYIHKNNTENDTKQTIHRTTQNIHRTQKFGRVRAMPRLYGFYPGICLTTEKKSRKTLSQVSHVIILIRFFSVTICNLLIDFPSYLNGMQEREMEFSRCKNVREYLEFHLQLTENITRFLM